MSDEFDEKDQKKVLDYLNDQSIKVHPSVDYSVEEIAKETGLNVEKVRAIGNDAIGRKWVDVDHYADAGEWTIRINSTGKTARDGLKSGKSSQNISANKIIAGRDVNIINAGNNNEIESKDASSKPNKYPKTNLIIAVVIAIGTVILVGYVVYDHLNQKETSTYQPPSIIANQNGFSVNNRAYLAVVNIQEYEPNKVWFIFENFGKVPNTDGIMRIAVGKNITRNELYNSSAPALPSGVLLPTQEKSQELLGLPDSYMMEAKSGTPLEIGILLQYHYAENGEGEYGVIAMYDNTSASFNLEDTWIK